MNWSMNRHGRQHCKAPSSTGHYFRVISRVWLDRYWWEHGRQNETQWILVGSPILIFQGQKEERRFISTVSRVLSGHCSVRSHLGRFRIVEDLMCKTTWFGTVKDFGWKEIVLLMRLPRWIGIPIRDLCALKKSSAVKCCLNFLRGFGIKLWWFGPSSVFEGLEKYPLGP
jgi:hypothetical protein